jgi:transcriptional regulator with GAF, ATPase, and Fis domain
MGYESLSERMTAAARELQNQHDPAATVKSAVSLLVQNVQGCDAASISLVHGKQRVETAVSSDELAATADRLQEQLGEGPCFDTLWHEESVYVPELSAEARWKRWAPRLVEETGARSILTFRLFTLSDLIGALTMYSRTRDAFTEADKAEGSSLAAHIAIAVLTAQRVQNYETALDSRAVIGQACGLLMERYKVDASQAFAILTRYSSSENIKLRDVAAELVRTRLLPPSR